MGSRIFGLVYPDWAAAQAQDVDEVCRDPDATVWVAVIDAKPVGFAAVRYGQEGGSRIGEVDMVAVDPDHQRAGIATRLLDVAVAEIAASGVPLAVIATGGDPGHAAARALYERAGFHAFPQVRFYRPTGDALTPFE